VVRGRDGIGIVVVAVVVAFRRSAAGSQSSYDG
jgi:hypothetical protein